MTVVARMLTLEADGIPPGTTHIGLGADLQAKHSDSEFLGKMDEAWHANHGFRHPDNDGFQPHYADLAWPLVTDFLQRRL